jgi:methyl-accepting chemotaxis protein
MQLDLIARLGVKRTLLVCSVLAILAGGIGTALVLRQTIRGALESAIAERGTSGAKVLGASLAPLYLQGGPVLSVGARINESWDERTHVYVIAIHQAGNTITGRKTRPDLGLAVDELVARHLQHGIDQPNTFLLGDIIAITQPLVVHTAAAAGQAGEDRRVGTLLVGLDASGVPGSVRRLETRLFLVLGMGGLAVVAFVYFLVIRLVLRPIADMSAVARRISDWDLTARAAAVSRDELGTLAGSLNHIGENLAATLARVQSVTGGVGVVIERISKTGSAVSSGVGTVSARVLDTSASMGNMIASLRGIAENVEVLAQSAEESSSSILEMAATNDEVAENIQGLAASVEETTAAIEEMTYSIKEVAKNIEELSATTEETSSSMNEMDVSISQVETNANETAKLSEQAQRDAEMGAEALSRTLAGIDKIKESSREAASVIETLGKKIAAIGNILNVIDDVAEQTNLLALNAAILAAQSGEHGKGFAVVADEIKDLAERTGASTKEIAELIRTVQDSSKQAVASMDRGVRNVEEGVRLGQEAETALKKIQESSEKSTQMVRSIARATIEQARGSKQVTVAINRIAETVQQIATATAEQARGSEQIMKSAEKMKAITKHVERSSQEQARGSKQITRAIESISEMVHHLNRAQKEQTKGSEQVMTAVVQIKQVAEGQTHSVRELEAAIVDLASQAETLRGEVRKFKV